MDRISTFQALQISIRINQTNFYLLDPTGLSHIILINTKWKEASPTNLASSTRPAFSTLATCPVTTINSDNSKQHFSTAKQLATSANGAESPEDTLLARRLRLQYLRWVFWNHILFLFTLPYQLYYFHLLLFPITYISPPLASHCFLIYRSSQIIYYDIIFTHIYSDVLLSHSNTQCPQILIQIFRQLLNRSLCHSLDSFFNGPSPGCFLVFSLVNSYFFLWDRTLGPKRHRPENRRSNGTGP